MDIEHKGFAFAFNPELQSICPVERTDENADILEFPSEVVGMPVKAIEATPTHMSSANGVRNNVKTVIIPDSVEKFYGSAFACYRELENVVFGDNPSLAEVGDGAFTGCSKLKEFSMPDSLTTIELNAFSGCTSLKKLHFGKNVRFDSFSDPLITFGNKLEEITADI